MPKNIESGPRELEEKQDPKGLRFLAERLMRDLERNIERCNRNMENWIKYKAEHNKEEHHDTFSDNSDEVAARYFALRELQTEGVISEEELVPLSQGLEKIIKYEDERLEARADAYATGYGEETESRRQAILNNADAEIIRGLSDHFEKQKEVGDK